MSKTCVQQHILKVIIPRGMIDPTETTVIEIPAELHKHPFLIAKKKVPAVTICSVVPTLDKCNNDMSTTPPDDDCSCDPPSSSSNYTKYASPPPARSRPKVPIHFFFRIKLRCFLILKSFYTGCLSFGFLYGKLKTIRDREWVNCSAF